MKLLINYLILFCLLSSYSFSQNYDEEFLDGTIMFELEESILSFDIINQTDKNIFSKDENISDYPELATIFNNIDIVKLERPSYFSNKRNLQTIFRIEFSDFDKLMN